MHCSQLLPPPLFLTPYVDAPSSARTDPTRSPFLSSLSPRPQCRPGSPGSPCTRPSLCFQRLSPRAIPSPSPAEDHGALCPLLPSRTPFLKPCTPSSPTPAPVLPATPAPRSHVFSEALLTALSSSAPGYRGTRSLCPHPGPSVIKARGHFLLFGVCPCVCSCRLLTASSVSHDPPGALVPHPRTQSRSPGLKAHLPPADPAPVPPGAPARLSCPSHCLPGSHVLSWAVTSPGLCPVGAQTPSSPRSPLGERLRTCEAPIQAPSCVSPPCSPQSCHRTRRTAGRHVPSVL